jgi:biotin transport system substrate-specific component
MINSSSAMPRPVWARNVIHVLRGIVLVAIGAAVIWGAGQVSFTIPGLSASTTPQSLAVLAIAALFGSSVAVTSVVAYIAALVFDFPTVLAWPPVAHLDSLLGPGGGFLIGLIAAAGIVGEAADRGASRNVFKLLIVLVLGEIALFALSFAWLAYGHAEGSLAFLGGLTAADIAARSPQDIVTTFILPVLPYEAAKVVIVAIAAPIVLAILGRFRRA